MSQNERINESMNEILLISERLIEELIVVAHENLPMLYRISEAISHLDILVSFAKKAIAENYGTN
jgi:DNA mismatch repair protein MSH4